MKKQFSKLTKAEQEKVELAYHQMKPEDFDELMANAQRHVPAASKLFESLENAHENNDADAETNQTTN